MATAGFPVGGGHQNPSSHRGHGFAFGHPQFVMPSQTAPTRNANITRAQSVGNNQRTLQQTSLGGNIYNNHNKGAS